MNTRTESFWLALTIAALLALFLAVVLAAILCLPWRSNFMVFQLPEKPALKPVPVIAIPDQPQPKPL